MNIEELINKSFGLLNELINKSDLIARNSNELLETLKLIENCNSCKENLGKHYFNGFHESINKIENFSVKLENERKKQHIIYNLNDKLIKTDSELNKKVLCENCKEKKIEKLTDKHGSEELAKFLYECKLNVNDDDEYIQWIPFNEFKNIRYLAKGGFGEVHRATWINYYNLIEDKYEDKRVVLKRIYNSNNTTSDILNEVKV